MAANGITFRIEGLKELDKALGELSKGLARGVLQRTLLKAGQPIADAAQRNAPYEGGGLVRSINASTKPPKDLRDAGKAAFAAVLKGGGSKGDAVAALRGARRGEALHAEVYIGPDRRPAIIQEWGTFSQPAQPFMRPAWDAKKGEALQIIKTQLAIEIDKTAKRAAARALKLRK